MDCQGAWGGGPGTPSWWQTLEARRFAALAELETGSRDGAAGRAGEVSRYAILPSVWREHTPLLLSAARNPFTALAVAREVMARRVRGRELTDQQWAMAWHAPSRKRWTRADRDYAERFHNLVGRSQ